jgi:hypothetical protein
MADREDIAEALSTVSGVSGFSFRPRVIGPGSGWPLTVTLNRGPAQNFDRTWKVVVVLPSDERAASTWFDEKFQAISDALEYQAGYVESIEPGNVDTDSGVLPCMIFTYRKEA